MAYLSPSLNFIRGTFWSLHGPPRPLGSLRPWHCRHSLPQRRHWAYSQRLSDQYLCLVNDQILSAITHCLSTSQFSSHAYARRKRLVSALTLGYTYCLYAEWEAQTVWDYSSWVTASTQSQVAPQSQNLGMSIHSDSVAMKKMIVGRLPSYLGAVKVNFPVEVLERTRNCSCQTCHWVTSILVLTPSNSPMNRSYQTWCRHTQMWSILSFMETLHPL